MIDAIIGIDFGTHYSSVGIFINGQVEIIPNNEGNWRTPSWVAFTQTQILVGETAKSQAGRNPANTIYDVKRLIGKRFDDPSVQTYIGKWPFKIVNECSRIKIEIEHKGIIELLFPEDITALIFRYLKETAEAYLKRAVHGVYITIPASFNILQRQATMSAAKMAGFNFIRVISEPVVSICSFIHIAFVKQRPEIRRNILVFNMGAGTFDASIMMIEDGIIEVISTAGSSNFGGEDFNERLVDFFVGEFIQKYQMNLTTNKRAMCRLKCACEEAKRTLSSATSAQIELDSLHERIDFKSSIERNSFEELNKDLFERTIQYIERALDDAKMKKTEIEEIVLCGGSSRIPKLRQLVEEFFNGMMLTLGSNPTETAILGVTQYTANRTRCEGDMVVAESHEIDFIAIDVTPLSIGIKDKGGAMQTVIQRNTPLPCKHTIILIVEDLDKIVSEAEELNHPFISVYGGEHAVATENCFLKNFILAEIPTNVSFVSITFDLDIDGILSLTASPCVQNNQDTGFKEEEVDGQENN